MAAFERASKDSSAAEERESLNEHDLTDEELGIDTPSSPQLPDLAESDISFRPDSLNLYSIRCHNAACSAGWWTEPSTQRQLLDTLYSNYVIGAKIALIHSEISEALEGHRKGLMDDKLPHRLMIEVELADALIRIFDLAGALQLDLDGAVAEKMAYNRTREDHQRESRSAPGGKSY